MSVLKSKRTEPRCNAVLSAKALVEYTLKITSNHKIFKNEYLTKRIVDMAEDIYILAYSANNVYVHDLDSRDMRLNTQFKSILNTKSLLALIDLSWHVEHLSGRRVNYWVELVVDAKEKLTAWYNSDKKRYKDIR